MPTHPLISIVTPTLNQAQYITATVHSVMDQGYPNLEYFVIDGGSNDGTQGVLDELKKDYGEVLRIFIEPGLKQVPAINKGLAMAKGEILAYINSDDVYLPGAFSTAVELFKQNPDAYWVAAPSIFFGESCKQAHIMPHKGPAHDLVIWLSRNFTPQPSVFWTRKAYQLFGSFDERYKYRFDHAYWLRFIERGFDPIWTECPMSGYRLHAASFTCSVPERFHEELADIRKEWSARLTARQRGRLKRLVRHGEANKFHEIALVTAQAGKRKQALQQWFAGIAHSPEMVFEFMTYLTLRRVFLPGSPRKKPGSAVRIPFRFASRQIARIKQFGNVSHLKIIFRDLLRLEPRVCSDSEHLQGAMDWLCRAQDATGCGGVSAMYSLKWGWAPPYPETTGYIIPTFITYAKNYRQPEFLGRALRMGEWEIEIQLPNGAVRGVKDNSPIQFDTGQVITGWLSLFRTTKDPKFLNAAVRAGNWLVEVQDSDGKWSRFNFRGPAHSYDTLVAAALADLHRLTGVGGYGTAVRKHVLWVLSLAEQNGWIRQMGLTETEVPPTHRIGYTLQGLLGCMECLDTAQRGKVLDLVERAAKRILALLEPRKGPFFLRHGLLENSFDSRWGSTDRHSCLTGNAQLALVLLEFGKLVESRAYSAAADRLIQGVKGVQDLQSANPGIRGGTAGSYPLWGDFVKWGYPNWAAKFFADALMLKEQLNRAPASWALAQDLNS